MKTIKALAGALWRMTSIVTIYVVLALLVGSGNSYAQDIYTGIERQTERIEKVSADFATSQRRLRSHPKQIEIRLL